MNSALCSGDAGSYAARLLDDLRADDGVAAVPAGPCPHPALRWAECGAMALTGRRDGPPLMCAVPLASCADGALLALQAIAAVPDGVLPAGGALLGERAALAGLIRNGRIAAGGACRLLDCADGRIALTLARADDWLALPALLPEIQPGARLDWETVSAAVAGQPAAALLQRGRLLSLAIAHEQLDRGAPKPWFAVDCEDTAATRRSGAPPLVVDLSALWAGPLCTQLLGLLGARVLKVECTSRPDGARAGSPAFFDLLNAGKASVALDLGTQHGRDMLRRVLSSADIVVEASRPRALEQLGIDAAEFCAAGRALTWISVTAHGRDVPERDWIGFGDDAGVAAGLATVMRQSTGEPVFCGDAIADPLCGMHAALAAWWSHRRGGARRIALSLRGVVQHCLAQAGPSSPWSLRERQSRWNDLLSATGQAARAPVARRPSGHARPLGADTAAVLATLSLPGARAVVA